MSWPARRLAFAVEYDGSDFAGWQIQPDQRTIQGSLAEAIAGVVGHPVEVQGASRTDAGVHARDQQAAATVRHPILCAGFAKAVNRRLPPAIAIRAVREVADDFNPRFANAGKTYCYRLYVDRERRPLVDRFAWRVHFALDAEQLAAAARACLGTHDFTSFAASDGSHSNAIRTLWRFALEHVDDVWHLRISGSAFLKQMVRNLVGTWVDCARGHLDPATIPAILSARDRTAAGPTAPARGLTLETIHPKAPVGASVTEPSSQGDPAR